MTRSSDAKEQRVRICLGFWFCCLGRYLPSSCLQWQVDTCRHCFCGVQWMLENTSKALADQFDPCITGLILASFDGFISRKARFCKEGVGLAGQVRSSKMLNSDSAHAARLICSRCRPHLNFISGENGSGKSAALQCLQVCLGVQARLTGRARSGKELINDNAATATAKVVLWNTVRPPSCACGSSALAWTCSP